MATELYTREKNGDSCITEHGLQIQRLMAEMIEGMLFLIEADGPVDLRDLQYVIHSATDEIILKQIISRRLTR